MHALNQSINQSISHPINRSINQRAHLSHYAKFACEREDRVQKYFVLSLIHLPYVISKIERNLSNFLIVDINLLPLTLPI